MPVPQPQRRSITSQQQSMAMSYPNLQAVNSPPISRPAPIQRPLLHTILRPSRKTLLPCSIHCPGVSGFPSLSCSACHCLFHPKCVGLPRDFSNNGAPFDFYCNDCKPSFAGTAASSVSQPSPTETTIVKNITSHAVPKPSNMAPSITSIQQQPARPILKRPAPPVEASPPPHARKKIKTSSAPPPLRPISGQTMVNIGGKKFLVIPRVDLELDSPPPSPPPDSNATTIKRKQIPS